MEPVPCKIASVREIIEQVLEFGYLDLLNKSNSILIHKWKDNARTELIQLTPVLIGCKKVDTKIRILKLKWYMGYGGTSLLKTTTFILYFN